MLHAYTMFLDQRIWVSTGYQVKVFFTRKDQEIDSVLVAADSLVLNLTNATILKHSSS